MLFSRTMTVVGLRTSRASMADSMRLPPMSPSPMLLHQGTVKQIRVFGFLRCRAYATLAAASNDRLLPQLVPEMTSGRSASTNWSAILCARRVDVRRQVRNGRRSPHPALFATAKPRRAISCGSGMVRLRRRRVEIRAVRRGDEQRPPLRLERLPGRRRRSTARCADPGRWRWACEGWICRRARSSIGATFETSSPRTRDGVGQAHFVQRGRTDRALAQDIDDGRDQLGLGVRHPR